MDILKDDYPHMRKSQSLNECINKQNTTHNENKILYTLKTHK